MLLSSLAERLGLTLRWLKRYSTHEGQSKTAAQPCLLLLSAGSARLFQGEQGQSPDQDCFILVLLFLLLLQIQG